MSMKILLIKNMHHSVQFKIFADKKTLNEDDEVHNAIGD